MSDWMQEYEGIYFALNGKHIKIVNVGNGWYAFENDIGDFRYKKYRKKEINKMRDVLIKRLSDKKHE